MGISLRVFPVGLGLIAEKEPDNLYAVLDSLTCTFSGSEFTLTCLLSLDLQSSRLM